MRKISEFFYWPLEVHIWWHYPCTLAGNNTLQFLSNKLNGALCIWLFLMQLFNFWWEFLNYIQTKWMTWMSVHINWTPLAIVSIPFFNGLNERVIQQKLTKSWRYVSAGTHAGQENLLLLHQLQWHFLLFRTHIFKSFYYVIPQYHNGYFDFTCLYHIGSS